MLQICSMYLRDVNLKKMACFQYHFLPIKIIHFQKFGGYFKIFLCVFKLKAKAIEY